MAGVKRPLAAMMGHDSAWTATSTPSPISQPSSSTESNIFSRKVVSLDILGNSLHFGKDASIALVGVRGTGKSTLAVMTAKAMKRRVIDLDTQFQKTYVLSPSEFKQLRGATELQARQADLMREVLDQNQKDAIIVCSWLDRRVQELLRGFATTNPVIHVVRDVVALQEHLKMPRKDRAQALFNMSNVLFRSCSSYEFFNVSDQGSRVTSWAGSESTKERLPAPYLTLKKAERHWLKFLSLICPAGSIPFIESAFPLARIAPEDRKFTYALSIPLSDVLVPGFEIEDYVAGVDAVQLEVQCIRREVGNRATILNALATEMTKGVGIIRRSTMLPIIVHVILPEGSPDDCIPQYLDAVAHALQLAPEMLTLNLRLNEYDISKLLAIKRSTKIIGDYQSDTMTSPWQADIWLSLYMKATRLGCDMVRLVRRGTCMEDNFDVARMRSSMLMLNGRRVPIIAYNSGRIGRNSACFNPILTAVAAKSTAQFDAAHSKVAITAMEATKALYSSFTYDPMKLYVFGANVGYSMSPAMHNAAFKACGIPHNYQPHSSDSLSGIKHLIEDAHFGGASIGLPFKVEVISLTSSLSRHARAIGAVNTLIPVRQLDASGAVPVGGAFFDGINRAGPVKALYGENTDWIGIRACMRRGLSPANAVVPKTCGLVIGAGGMARAAVYAMLQAGVKNILVYNRTPANADKMIAHFAQTLQQDDLELPYAEGEFSFTVIRDINDPWPEDLCQPTVIISCIPTHPIGDIPAPDFTAPESWLGSSTGGVILELGYKSLDTPLLAQARERASKGWVAMDGLDLLPEQGFAQFELFTGRRAPKQVMRRDLLKSYTESQGRSDLGGVHKRLRSITERDD